MIQSFWIVPVKTRSKKLRRGLRARRSGRRWRGRRCRAVRRQDADERPRAVAEGAGMAPGEAIAAEFDIPAEAIEGGAPLTGFLPRVHERNVGLRRARLGIDQLLAVEAAAVEFEPQPFGEVAGAGGNAAGRRLGVRLPRRQRRLHAPSLPTCRAARFGCARKSA